MAVLWGGSIVGQKMAYGDQIRERAAGGVIIGLSPAVTALLGDVDSRCPATRRVAGGLLSFAGVEWSQ